MLEDKQRMMANANAVALNIAKCGESERGQWLSYLLEALESEAGEGVLEEIQEMLKDRLDRGCW